MPPNILRGLLLSGAATLLSNLGAAPVAVDDTFVTSEDRTLTVTASAELIADSFDAGAIPLAGNWTYLDTLENELGANHAYPVDGSARAWNHPDFNPATSTLSPWKSAPAPLQSGGIQAFPGDTPDLLLGIDAAPNGEWNLSTTYLFRNSFELTSAQVSAASDFSLVHLLDDGAAIYINGIEVARPNMPEGELTPTTFALGSVPDENNYASTPVDLTGIVQPGVNTIAVELHQGDISSSDVGFDLLITKASGLTYVDDPFGTDNPDYASGQLEPDAGFSGAGITATAGGRPPFNSATSAGWQQGFDLPAATTVSLSLRYRLFQESNLEPSEYSEAVVTIDGTRFGDGEENSLARFYGDGNGGDPNDTGWQSATFEIPLAAGQHTLTLGVYNNGTSQAQELATAFFDDILLSSAQATGGVLANDLGSPESATLRDGPRNGSIEFSPDGTFVYTPDPDFFGTDSFTYVATDASGTSAPATALIQIATENDPPAAVADRFPATEDTPLMIGAPTGLLANDTDIDSAQLVVTGVTYSGPGTLAVDPDGSFTYTPAPEFSGEDSFTYRASDGDLDSHPATAVIDVAYVDDTPVSHPDTYATSPATPLVVNSPALSLVANDTDAENQTLSAVSATAPTSGSLDLDPGGTFTYTPAPGFAGTATFTYRASDGNTESPPALVTIHVNSRPVAAPNAFTLIEDSTLVVDPPSGLLANASDAETDPLATSVVAPPSHGVILLQPDGSFAYQPDPDFAGTDVFTFIARDAFQASEPATTTLTVTPVNDPPTAVADAYRTLLDQTLTVPDSNGLLANDTDPDNTSLTVSLVSPPTSGTLDLEPGGGFTFTPEPGSTATVRFSYQATDGALPSSPTEVEIDVDSPSQNIVISEIMYHPESESDADEFIELHNTGEVPVDLSGWSFTSGVSLSFPAVTLPPGGYLVAAADPATFATTYPESSATVVGPWTGRLSNSGERIRLKDSTGLEIDDLTYADQGAWAVRRPETHRSQDGWVWSAAHDGGGSSLELINPRFSNKHPQNWTSSQGAPTPGQQNSTASDDIAPVISDVSHRPVVPRPGDTVTVQAEIENDSPAELSATLHYRVSLSGSQPNPFTTVPMTPGSSGRFAAAVPPLPDGTVVEFYISASDGTSERSYPGPSDAAGNHDANLLFQVDDERWSGDEPIYRLVIRPSEEEVFVEDGSEETWNNGSDAQVNATFIATQGTETTVRYLCGVRRRGAGSRNRFPHNWRVNIPRDEPWNGVASLNLNTQFTFLQFIGNKLAQSADLASADLCPVSVRMNGIDHSNDSAANGRYGLYVHAEVADSEFAASHFPDDPQGNLYRARRPDSQWAYLNGDFDGYPGDGWAKQTNASQNDWSDLDNLLRVMNTASGPTYFDQVSAVANVDQWVRWFAFMALINSRETNLSNGTDDDYYMYSGVRDPRFVIIPHDFDTILGQGDTATDPDSPIFQPITDFGGRVMQVFFPFFQDPTIASRYYAALEELANTVFAPDHFDPFLDNGLGGWVPQDRIDELKEFMAERRTYVLSQIPSAITAGSDLDFQDGYPRTTSLTDFQIGGRIDPIRTRRVLVNGVEASFDPFTATWASNSGTATLIPFGATWKYLDDGSDQGTAWKNSFYFPALAWPDGPAPLGYGDDGETTQVGFGDDPDQKFATTYFRTSFEVPDPAQFSSYELTVAYDDGFAAYLNGEEVARVNLDEGAQFDAYTPEAQADQVSVPIDTSRVLPGQNILAIEVHQAAPTSSDIWLDARLRGSTVIDYGLVPGLNKIAVTALGEGDTPIGSTTVDLWVDAGPPVALAGTLTSDTTLVAASGPYKVSGNLVVPDGVTLTITPGTSVYFDDGARITVLGTLVAEGTPASRIFLAQEPGDNGGWDGIRFNSTLGDNRLHHLDFHGASGSTRVLGVAASRLSIDDVSWTGSTNMAIDSSSPQISVTDCRFPTTINFPVIRNNGMSATGSFVLEGCSFAQAIDGNHIIEFTGGQHPGNVFQAYDNSFPGAFSHAIELVDSDAYFEGNTFAQILSTDPVIHPVPAAAIHANAGSAITAVRNTFSGVDHALSLSGNATAHFTHNTVSGVAFSAIYFDNPTSGSTAFVGHSVFELGTFLVDGASPAVSFTLDDSIIDAGYHVLGTGNFDVDPSLAPSLLASRGASVPAGASVSPPPPARTSLDNASLDIAGPGIVSYRHAVNGGPLGPETPVSTPILLNALPDGTYTVTVIGKNAAGRWQQTPTSTPTWEVDAGLKRVRINEVLADNRTAFAHGSTFPDYVEIWNDSPTPTNIAGFMLSDDPGSPDKFTFPAGTTIPARSYLVVFANSPDGTPGLHTGFGLDSDGEHLTLYSSTGATLDSVSFGFQSSDISLGRSGHTGAWTANHPTPGTPNITIPLAGQRTLKINEWLASNRIVARDDFVELYNPSPFPAPLDGLALTDDPIHRPLKAPFTPNSFVPGNGFLALTAGGKDLPFNLSKEYGAIAIGGSGSTIDRVHYVSQRDDISEGRITDGAPALAYFDLPTPGLSNSTDLTAEAELINFLRITEIMYHPPGGSDAEFVELHNTGSTPLDLTGLRLSGGIAFDFVPGTTIAPGGFLVVVADPATFSAIYGDGIDTTGPFSGKLNNAGEDLRLEIASLGAGILDFDYNDSWYPSTDGSGRSLVVADALQPRTAWRDASGWRAGGIDLGTPGTGELVSVVATAPESTSLPSTLTLSATPFPPTATLSWTRQSGPGFVDFDDPTTASPAATFSTPGRYTIQVTATSAGATASAALTVDVLDSYSAWSDRNLPGVPPAFAAPDFDFDTDGLPNLLEYTLGLSPVFPDPHPFSEFSYTVGSFSLTYRQPYLDSSELDLEFEASSDLGSWLPADVTRTVIADDGRTRTVRVTHSPPATDPLRSLYLRATSTLR